MISDKHQSLYHACYLLKCGKLSQGDHTFEVSLGFLSLCTKQRDITSTNNATRASIQQVSTYFREILDPIVIFKVNIVSSLICFQGSLYLGQGEHSQTVEF